MYTKEIQELALADYKIGRSAREICAEYKISRSCLYKWVNANEVHRDKKTENKFTYKQLEILQRQVYKLTRENEILKFAYEQLNPSLKQKLEIADLLNGKYKTKEMCRVIQVDHSTFYNHDRRGVKVTQNQIRNERLKEKILEIYNKSGGRFGSNKIFEKLKAQGIPCSLGKISSLFKELGLVSKRRKRPVKKASKPKKFYSKNKLKQNFVQSRPNLFWVGDVTEVKIKSTKFYICTVMDLFSRKIVGYRLSSQNNNKLTVNTFKDAYEARERPKGLTFHSDQGSNYTSNEFADLLDAVNVGQSLSQAGTPYDNSVIEAFFSNFKQDDLNSCEFENFDELQIVVDRYIEYYNSYRPHEFLRYKTPDEVEMEYKQLENFVLF